MMLFFYPECYKVLFVPAHDLYIVLQKPGVQTAMHGRFYNLYSPVAVRVSLLYG